MNREKVIEIANHLDLSKLKKEIIEEKTIPDVYKNKVDDLLVEYRRFLSIKVICKDTHRHPKLLPSDIIMQVWAIHLRFPCNYKDCGFKLGAPRGKIVYDPSLHAQQNRQEMTKSRYQSIFQTRPPTIFWGDSPVADIKAKPSVDIITKLVADNKANPADIIHTEVQAATKNEELWADVFSKNLADVFSRNLNMNSWHLGKDGPVKMERCVAADFVCQNQLRWNQGVCGKKWDSTTVTVIFQYEIELDKHRGVIQIKEYGQSCQKCNNSQTYALPTIDPYSADKAAVKLKQKILEKFYGENPQELPDSSHGRRERMTPHDKANCEACVKGVCAGSEGRRNMWQMERHEHVDRVREVVLDGRKIEQWFIKINESQKEIKIEKNLSRNTSDSNGSYGGDRGRGGGYGGRDGGGRCEGGLGGGGGYGDHNGGGRGGGGGYGSSRGGRLYGSDGGFGGKRGGRRDGGGRRGGGGFDGRGGGRGGLYEGRRDRRGGGRGGGGEFDGRKRRGGGRGGMYGGRRDRDGGQGGYGGRGGPIRRRGGNRDRRQPY